MKIKSLSFVLTTFLIGFLPSIAAAADEAAPAGEVKSESMLNELIKGGWVMIPLAIGPFRTWPTVLSLRVE